MNGFFLLLNQFFILYEICFVKNHTMIKFKSLFFKTFARILRFQKMPKITFLKLLILMPSGFSGIFFKKLGLKIMKIYFF